ncbi:MAG: dUTP diphosphatase [Nanoarchaeota archaeon]|nr:dUTP diphosphatase [Nanoarchaeota archaeon]
MEIKIQRLDKNIELPGYSHEGDAALDLKSAEDYALKPMEQKIFKTGIKMAIPVGNVGLIWDRSGLASKNSIHALAGVVDSCYRGEIGIVLINLGKEDFKVEKGMRIAQMLIQPVVNANILEEDELDGTKRGDGGFGSTGVH